MANKKEQAALGGRYLCGLLLKIMRLRNLGDCRAWGLVVVSLLLTLQGWAQTRYTVSGTVRGAGGETLPGASVAVPVLGTGTAADSAGHFSLSLPAGPHQLVVASIGYKPTTRAIILTKNQRLSFNLDASSSELGEVIVEGSQSLEQKLKTTQMGVEHLSIREAKLLPALFGEVDILKTLQLKPGVSSGGEGSSGLFVRAAHRTRIWCCSTMLCFTTQTTCSGCFRYSTPMP